MRAALGAFFFGVLLGGGCGSPCNDRFPHLCGSAACDDAARCCAAMADPAGLARCATTDQDLSRVSDTDARSAVCANLKAGLRDLCPALRPAALPGHGGP